MAAFADILKVSIQILYFSSPFAYNSAKRLALWNDNMLSPKQFYVLGNIDQNPPPPRNTCLTHIYTLSYSLSRQNVAFDYIVLLFQDMS